MVVQRKSETPEQKALYRRRWRLKRLGLTIADYERFLAAQGGECVGCGKVPTTRALSVVMGRKRKAVHGLLCSTCRHTMGVSRKNPARLRGLADFVEAWRAGE